MICLIKAVAAVAVAVAATVAVAAVGAVVVATVLVMSVVCYHESTADCCGRTPWKTDS